VLYDIKSALNVGVDDHCTLMAVMLCIVSAVPVLYQISSLVMTSSVSCLDVSDSLVLSTPEVLNSSVTNVTATLAHTQVYCPLSL